jgi:triacylglycerol lipase
MRYLKSFTVLTFLASVSINAVIG